MRGTPTFGGAVCCWNRRFVAVAWLAFAIAVAPGAAVAQISTGTINGVATDETGAVLPGVSITSTNVATGQTRTVVTNNAGRFQIAGLPPGSYSVLAELQGFSTVVRAQVTVPLGSVVDVEMSLKVGSLEETVTVTGEAPLIDRAQTDMSSIITQAALENLPSKNRQYLDFALLLPGSVESVSAIQGTGVVIGGTRSKEGTLLVDGFYNLDEGFTMPKQRHSQDTIQEFQLVTFGGAPEYGRAIGGMINSVTKSGTNNLSGSGYGFFRGTWMNAQAIEERLRGTPKSPYDRQQWGGSVGGPIKQNRTFFFGAFERLNENWPFDNGISASDAAVIGLPAGDVGTVPRYQTSVFAFAKVDHTINSKQRLQGSFSYTDSVDQQFSFPNARATRSFTQQLPFLDWAYLLNWTNITAEGRMFHEVKASYFPRDYHSNGLQQGGPPLVADGQINTGNQSNASPPRVTISSVASFGSATIQNHIKTYPTQMIYTSSVFHDAHTIKFGADYMHAYYNYEQFNPLRGAYTFSSLANYQRGAYTQYTQSFGATANNRTHQYISGFIQDSWQATKRLTLNYGLRYDLEFNPKQEASGIPWGNDYNNVGPRFAFSYDVTDKGTTFLKVTSGVFYDRIWNNATNNLYSLKDHVTRQSYTWTPTSPGAPVYPNVFATPPPNLPVALRDVIIMPSEVKVPMSAQFIAKVDHQFTSQIAISFSGIYTKSWFKETNIDTNLGPFDPVSRTFARIDPNYRAITQTFYAGPAEYQGAVVELMRRGNRIGATGSLTVSRALQASGTPSDPTRGILADYGRVPDNPTYRGVLSGWINFTPQIQFSSNFTAHSGRAVNPVASGLDLNGDGNTGDRTPGFDAFELNGPGFNRWDARLTWSLPVGGANKRKLHTYLEAYNLTNHVNARTVDNNYGATKDQPLPGFMVPTTYFPPREVQIGVRLVF